MHLYVDAYTNILYIRSWLQECYIYSLKHKSHQQATFTGRNSYNQVDRIDGFSMPDMTLDTSE